MSFFNALGFVFRAAGAAGATAVCSLLVLGAPAAWANPSAPVVKAGAVTFAQGGGTFTVNQTTTNAIVNWGAFGNNAGETIRFNQPGSHAAILNRVTGGDPTKILGQLSANGRVFVINPRGVLVGAGAMINTNAFIASTHDVADSAFLAGGDLTFAGDSTAGIVNLGTIQADGGDIVLIARTVENWGTLRAPQGVAGLAAGAEILLKAGGADRIFVLSGAGGETAARGVDNAGVIDAAQAELKAAGGSAYALAVNSGGAVTATGIGERGGRIVLTAGGGDVAVSGTLSAKNRDGSGGEILVGGDYQGGNAANVARAANVTISDTARLTADAAVQAQAGAAANSDGGKIVVWSDGLTRFDGAASATGARGGAVEISGARLALTGHVDLRGFTGAAGTLLLDPVDLVIDGGATPYGGETVGATWISEQLELGNVTLQANNSITGDAGATISWDAATRLSLAAPSVVIHGGIAGSNADSQLLISGANITNITGAVAVNEVRYAANTGTARASFNLTNTDNAFARLIMNDGEGTGVVTFNSGFNVVNSRSLSLGNAAAPGTTGAFSVAGSGVTLAITAAGDLILENADTRMSAEDGGEIVLRADGGQFANRAGVNAIEAGGDTRARIYSTSTGTHNGTAFADGGLAGFALQRGVAAGADPLGAGNVFYFSNRLLTVTALDASRIYGAANPAFHANYSGFGPGDSESLVTGLQFTAPAAGANAGVYTGGIVPFGATADGYDFNYVSATLTIDRAELRIVAAGDSRLYGAANPSFTANYVGLVNGDTEAVVTPVLATAATTASGVGGYAITASGPAQTTNYAVRYFDGTLTINPAPLTITAGSASRTYGAANPGFTFTADGFVNGDTASVLSGVQVGTAATVRTGVGDYAITASGGSTANYTLGYLPGTLTITPADLFITAGNLSRTYGGANPVFTGTITGGLKNGDSFDVSLVSFTSSATATSPVGAYAISGSGDAVGNYRPVVSGSLAITPAPLTITADNLARTYGDANPALTFTVSGMVNGEDAPAVAFSLNTPANAASGVGAYAITGAGGSTTDTNYRIGAFAPGVLTINPLAITITAGNATRLYGDGNPGFGGTYATTNSANNTSGAFSGVTNFAGGAVVFALGTAATVTSNVGDYAITPRLLSGNAANVTLTVEPGTLAITPAPLTVTPYLTLTASSAPQADYTQSPLAPVVTEVTTNYQAGGPDYVVTTYKQEVINAAAGTVLYVKVVSTPAVVDPIIRTHDNGTVDMFANNVRYTSRDGVTYTRDTKPGPDNSQGTVTFNPNVARTITAGDALPAVGLAFSGLRNNDTIGYTYSLPSMPAVNAVYSLAAPVLNPNPNYTVTLNTADLSFRLNPLALRLTLPDLTIPSNLVIPTQADLGFNVIGDRTLADYTQDYLDLIQILNAPTAEHMAAITGGRLVSASANAAGLATVDVPPHAPLKPGEYVVFPVGYTGSSLPPNPSASDVVGLKFNNPDFLVTALKAAADAVIAARKTGGNGGGALTELAAFYTVTPTLGLTGGNSGYFTFDGSTYERAYRLTPGGQQIKMPKTWSRVFIGPELPPPLPPDSQTGAAGIDAAQAAIKKAEDDARRAELEQNSGGTPVTSTTLGSINTVNVSNDQDPGFGRYLANVRPEPNAFGLGPESNSYLAGALWLWASQNNMPLPRGEADAATIARLYQLAANDPAAKAQIAGYLATMMLDILARSSAVPPVAISAADQAFVNELSTYIQQRQIDAYNAAAQKVEQYEKDWAAAHAQSTQVTQGNMVNMLNTGMLGVEIPDPPKEVFQDAGQWMPVFGNDDPSFQGVVRTIDTVSATLATSAGSIATSTAGGLSSLTLTTAQQSTSGVTSAVGRALFPHMVNAVDQATQAGFSTAARVAGSAAFVAGVATTVAQVLAAVITPFTEKAKFVNKVEELRQTIAAGDPAASPLALMRANPYDPNTQPVLYQQAQAQILSQGYSAAGATTIVALMTAMICGNPQS